MSETLDDDRGSRIGLETKAGGFSPSPELAEIGQAALSDDWSMSASDIASDDSNFSASFQTPSSLGDFEFPSDKADSDDFARRLRARRLRRTWLFVLLILTAVGGIYYYYRHFEPPVMVHEVEPNDEVRQANLFRLGQSLVGYIGRRTDRKKSDQDVYMFQLSPSMSALDIRLTGVRTRFGFRCLHLRWSSN